MSNLLVSVVMPVHGRRPIARLALASYLGQDYANRELLVIDDSPEPLDELFSGIETVRYIWTGDDLSIGTKRNLACSAARGDIICHMDSDDISATNRISTQVNDLLTCGREITGFHTLPFFDLLFGRAHLYSYNPKFCCGASLVYYRDFWKTHEFPNVDIGEDLPYTVENADHRHTTDGRRLMVALLHADNISSRQSVSRMPNVFPEIPVSDLPDFIFPCIQSMDVSYNSSVVQ